MIETFYVLDFDRTLGNVEASFGLLSEVAHDLLVVDRETLRQARSEVEASSGSFSVLEFIKEHSPSANLHALELEYARRALNIQDELLEPGVHEFMDFLTQAKHPFCIMSFGDPVWQTLKIDAAGFRESPTLIVPTKQKGDFIAHWQDKTSDYFAIPATCFLDGVPRQARSIVLVDDKPAAFVGLPEGARGYIVPSTRRLEVSNEGFPWSQVTSVARIDEIIALES
ncbi:MAG TPA: hypothetical protein VFS65_02740 [Candidatus Saccharimonadales bacterium]|nr:hypothetical protein [Candidatus Saccharimonadales bacterium]